MADIEHAWFDLDGTLVFHTPKFHQTHNNLRYDTYAAATGRPRTAALEQEYEALYRKYGTNAAVFRSLGLPSDYWALRAQTMEPTRFYKPLPAVYETVQRLAQIVPVSLFSNSKPRSISEKLKAIDVDQGLFTYIIRGDDVAERKPVLDGFHLIIQKSRLPAEAILYVGDRIDADIKPAKAVGMKTCLVWSESPEADYSALNFRELLDIFS
jgi:HAD superfamily hydrolase (TIGR01549 family)